jgi:hypothetical protein
LADAVSPSSSPDCVGLHRYLDYQMAFEAVLQDLVEEGIEAGWQPDEVIDALCTEVRS